MTRSLVLLCLAAGCAKGAPVPAVEPSARMLARAAAQDRGAAEPMLERVEDEDTRWVELPHFGECPFDPHEIPPFVEVDDDHVPALTSDRERATNMDAGDEALDNRSLLRHLDSATQAILGCIGVAACYETETVDSGAIDVAFELDPGGRVQAVNVDPTPELQRWGVPACARKAVYDTDFADYDGGHMVVTYRIELD